MKNKLLIILTCIMVACLSMGIFTACNEHVHSYTEEVTKPTCTQMGYTTHTCECGDSYVDTYVGALGHTYTQQVTAPTCKAMGYTTNTCACGDSYISDYTDKVAHVYTAVVTEPTCTKLGYTTNTCECGDSYISDYVNVVDHNYGEGISNGNNTHTKNCIYDSAHKITENCYGGTATCEDRAICVDCKKEYGSPLGHSYSNWIYNGDGTQTGTCLHNSEHKLVKSIFYINENEITGLTDLGKLLNSIIIPEKINGVTVRSIGDSAFINCASLTSVEIPNSVTSIASSAFDGCNNLSKLNYLGTIDEWAQIEFDSVYANPLYYAKKLYINDVLVTEANISTATKINNFAFYGCSSLQSITIGDSVTNVGLSAFVNCTSLQCVTIGNGVTSIGQAAFYDCTSLQSVTIGDSVTSIGDMAFYNSNNLSKVNYLGTIDEWAQIEFDSSYANPLYYAEKLYINDVLVTEANISTATKINNFAFYGCTSLTSIEIPNSVTSIGWAAFGHCTSLTEIVIPNSVTSIGHYAFHGCTSLTEIVIPDSVTSIGYDAFSDCTSLETIKFNGTKSEWNKITKDFYWNHNVPATKVICTDGEVNL